MPFLRIAAAQFNPTVGSIEGNAERVYSLIVQAQEQDVDLVVFPELALLGYPPEDLLLRPQVVRANLRALNDLAVRVTGIVAIVGFVDQASDLFNALAVIADGSVKLVYRKRILPNYTVFDEVRYFRPGEAVAATFVLNDVRVGLAICEDAWSPTGPIAESGRRGADLVVVANASPFEFDRQDERERLMSVRAGDASVSLLYVNQVGGQDELVFDGGSFLVDHNGVVVDRASRFREELWVVDYQFDGDRYRKRLLDPRGEERSVGSSADEVVISIPRPVDAQINVRLHPSPQLARFDPAEVYEALIVGLRDYIDKNGFCGALVALSGGIDSALVATLAVDALGKEMLQLVGMPSRYSSMGSITDAIALATNLGSQFIQVPIETAHDALGKLIREMQPELVPVVDENLQSRIRGVVMMALSNQTGAVVLTTGNKSELAVGYSTLYGDTAGGYAVIKDLYKTQVYRLCAYINERARYDRIPAAILDKPPSAELRPDQRDSDSLPAYEILDPILYALVDEDRSVGDLVQRGVDRELANRLSGLVDRAEYKRRQSPVGVRLSHKAFGRDRRMPITNGAREDGFDG
ncbi:MAG: NAD+ synthase [Ferrimicrobium sp.]